MSEARVLGELALFPQKDDGPAGPSPIAYGLVDRSGKTVAARVPIVAGRSTAQRAAVASYGQGAIVAWRSGGAGERVGLAGFRARPPGLTIPAGRRARRPRGLSRATSGPDHPCGRRRAPARAVRGTER
jgi:hypothetical protein